MASRFGSRPAGSDGSDFQHRERVIEPYNQSPIFKRRLRTTFTLHLAIWILVAMKVLPEVLFRFGFVSRAFIRKYALPPNELWEYAWLFGSILPILFGYLAFPKNRVYLIRFSLIGTIVFGFVPVMMGCFLRAFELMDYYYTKNIRHEIFNFPFIVLLYIFFSIAFQIHCFELYFTFKLMAMWSRLSKKNA